VRMRNSVCIDKLAEEDFDNLLKSSLKNDTAAHRRKFKRLPGNDGHSSRRASR
jgi:hypothetical protein